MSAVVLCAVLLLSVCQAVVSDVVVETALGLVVGERTEQFTTFLGIPYGRVNNSDPFGAAITAPSFTEPFQAKQDPPVCPQLTFAGDIEGNINCLNLNVIAPNDATSNSNLPVMVYVHGGGFVEGNGNIGTYTPTFLVKRGILYVSINYRLGAYGFVCLPELGYSNQGLQDIILALKWIKAHIKNFGGDDENILVFGQSAGSVSLDLILQYNDNNVFNKIILHSGQVASPLVAGDIAGEDYIATVAQRLNIQSTVTADIMRELSALSTEELIDITKFDRVMPCIDNFFDNVPRKDNYRDMKILTGATDVDALFLYFMEPASSDQDKIIAGLDYKFLNFPQEAVDSVANYYFVENDYNVVDFGTDHYYHHPIERSARFYRENNATVYRFVFSHDGGRNLLKLGANITDPGAVHGDELGYLFDVFEGEITEEDQYVIDAIVTLWTNFAKYGDPTPQGSIVSWPKLDDDTNTYVDIAYPLTLLDHPYEDRTVFWDQFYQRYRDTIRGFDVL